MVLPGALLNILRVGVAYQYRGSPRERSGEADSASCDYANVKAH